jgi:hypothetical protein
MTAHFLFVEVRSIEMRADDPAQTALRLGAVEAQRPGVPEEREGLLMAGHRAGRDNAGRSVARVRGGRRLERFEGAVHEVGVVAAVHMQIDEPRSHVSTARVDRRS